MKVDFSNKTQGFHYPAKHLSVPSPEKKEPANGFSLFHSQEGKKTRNVQVVDM